MPAILIAATAARRIIIVGSGFLIMSLRGTSRIEAKHKTRANAPAMLIVILDVMMPNDQGERREAAAPDARFASDLDGCFPFAPPAGC